MYAEKPMQGRSLMQAIARVNRVFRDKPGGLVVDLGGVPNTCQFVSLPGMFASANHSPKPPRVSCPKTRLALSRVVVLGLADQLKHALIT